MDDHNNTGSDPVKKTLRQPGDCEASLDMKDFTLKHDPPGISSSSLEIILDSVPSYIFYKDEDDRYVNVNKAMAEVCGIPKENWTGKTTAELFPDFSADFLLLDQEVISSGKAFRNIEQLFHTPEGIKWLQTDKIPHIDENGKVKGVVSISTDITKRKEVETSLKVSETKYRIVAENTYDWEFWISPDGCFIYSSPSCMRISGYGAEEFENDPKLFESIIYPEDLDFYLSHTCDKKSYHEQTEIEFRIVKRGGEVRWIAHLSQPAYGPENVLLGRRGSNRDITERKIAEEALSMSEKRYRILAQNFPNGCVILFDKNLRYIVADGNEIARTSPYLDSVVGKTIWELYPPETCKLIEPFYRAALDGKENIFIQKLFDRFYEFHTLPIKEKDGLVSAGMCLMLDVTKKIQDEEELKAINAGKDKLFSIIAHDLKSPFTALLGFSEYMTNYLEDLNPDEIKEFAGSIYKSASGVYKLIENLLQWSRLQLGRIEFVPQAFNFYELGDEVVQLYQANACKKKITLCYEIEPALMVYADKQMTDTILRNLISNAIKFTGQAGTVSLMAQRDKDVVKISVIDTGKGMDSLQLSKLFSLSENRTTPGTEQEKGTGLGLLICKEFVEKNGGTLAVESLTGHGSSFTFTLPLALK
ncbi:MAG: PAS domain-containing sensor histidine kinase [Ignavibacteria bacterium]|jgi:PAS domain S-box-containing protein|nr:PAS domain-containing sensor histidine kinase [Ignavibacteria bacterium]